MVDRGMQKESMSVSKKWQDDDTLLKETANVFLSGDLEIYNLNKII